MPAAGALLAVGQEAARLAPEVLQAVGHQVQEVARGNPWAERSGCLAQRGACPAVAQPLAAWAVEGLLVLASAA